MIVLVNITNQVRDEELITSKFILKTGDTGTGWISGCNEIKNIFDRGVRRTDCMYHISDNLIAVESMESQSYDYCGDVYGIQKYARINCIMQPGIPTGYNFLTHALSC